MSSIADRLKVERRHRFIGRTQECALFQAAIAAAELPFQLLSVWGDSGTGKTTLLTEFVRLCEHSSVSVICLDSRAIEPNSDAFLRAIAFADEARVLQPASADRSERVVLLVDTYELLEPIDDWLREAFLPRLPENTVIVLAGRNPLSSNWRVDLGWQALIHALPLGNFSPDEGRLYLTQRQIPIDQHSTVLGFTHGHPLALSLIADVFDQEPQATFQPEAMPDVIRTLLVRFVQSVPTPLHRRTLEACAVVRLMTESLLATLLNLPAVDATQTDAEECSAHALFEWLRQRSFIESGRIGLLPHDLVREVLVTDLRWRDPDWFVELHLRARHYYTTRLDQTEGSERYRLLFDYIFLHRHNAVVRNRFIWQGTNELVADGLQESDRAPILEMVRQHEGEASAELVAYWLTRQPDGAAIFRDRQQQPTGFVLKVALHQVTAGDCAIDPAVAAAHQYLAAHAPLRSGEGATLFRFWMARDSYQTVSTTQSLIFTYFIQHHKTTPGLAFTLIPCADPAFWSEMFDYASLPRIPEADFQVGGRHYGVFGHDWRIEPMAVWQIKLARREILDSVPAELPPTPARLVLTQEAFEAAIRQALQHFCTPDRLRQNPLLRSRLLTSSTNQGAPDELIDHLQTLLRQTIETLQQTPRTAKLYRALYYTYLQPASSQERAAEILDLPFSTFRRHLTLGVKRVAELLWQQEIAQER